jgi:flagellar biosynthesis protein FliR
MTFPFCGRAFFPSGIGNADETIAFGKKSFVYFVSLAASFICFRIIASATLAISSRCAPCLHQTLCCPMRIVIRDGWTAQHKGDGQKKRLVCVLQ